MVEHLPSKYQALDLIHRTGKNPGVPRNNLIKTDDIYDKK
jgi:hypothetical protein